MNLFIKTLLPIFIISLFSQSLYSQVTIGSGVAPNIGALLDLKEYDDAIAQQGGRTALKGLGLPRVKIVAPDQLELDGYTGSLEADEHIGLLVYNMEAPVFNPLTCKLDGSPLGLNVWDGSQWQSLAPNSSVGESIGTLGSVTGKSGTIYKTRVFGDAGEWMIENLRETTYDEGETGTINEDRNISNSYTNKAYYYPTNQNIDQHTGVVSHDRQLFDKHPELGLLYTAAGASNGNSTDNFASGAGAAASTVQGICPKGWKLPSDKDWTDLEKEIALHPELYSQNVAGSTTWSDTWATSRGERPVSGSNVGHGQSMKACLAVTGSSTVAGGLSTDKGFNFLLTGSLSAGLGQYYGTNSMAWSSSTNGSVSWFRSLGVYAGVGRSYANGPQMFSVRCKKG